VAALGLWLIAPTPSEAELPYQLVDRRELDGSVLLVRRMSRTNPGSEPFTVGRTWELIPASHYFRVKDGRIPAKRRLTGDPPAVTFKGGEMVDNSILTAFGGSSKRFFEQGEIVRLVDLNAAFSSVRMDLESICLFDRGGPVRGRAVFVLSGQVSKKTFDEANLAVAAVLEPVGLHQITRQCDPSTGLPPPELRPEMPLEAVVDLLGPPAVERTEDGLVVYDYGSLVVFAEDGAVSRLSIPALD
jgi:hypothetical protein